MPRDNFRNAGHFAEGDEVQEFDYAVHLGPFHISDNGVVKTTSLIYEGPMNNKDECVFTLKDEDYINQYGKYLFSLPKLYLSIGDPTEYAFAKAVFRSWDKWNKLSEAKFMQPHVESWRNELAVKLRSDAIRGINKTAKDSEVSETVRFNAQKYVAEEAWNSKKRRGRPSKAEVERERKIQAGINEELEDDFDRINKVY